MTAKDKVASSSVTGLGNRDERLAIICGNLRSILVELDDLDLKIAGAHLDGVIVRLEQERDQSSE